MNDTEQRIAIAKARGCTMATDLDGFWVFSQPGQLDKRVAKHHSEEDAWRLCAKNYPTDLNAMHEAEKHLGLKYDKWTRELRVICLRDRRCIESATAAQRAEAFLRTLDLWKP